jgi:FkbM family methyltransferase
MIGRKRKHDPPVARSDYGIVSYSQEGEDVVLRRFVGEKPGFYVDIGAHHPQRFSNTYYYYLLGWRGLNVDADPDLIEEFKSLRPRDRSVACGVGNKNETLTFYVFNERAINTFDRKVAEARLKLDKSWKIIEEKRIEVVTTATLLDRYLPKRQKIDFMSIDVEGKDMEALTSNDWERYRPRFLLVECYAPGGSDKVYARTTAYMLKHRYKPVAKTIFTAIYADEDLYVGY